MLAGTNLGDPIELVAASAVLLPGAAPEEDAGLPMALAAGKSSIGHTEPAAGLAGIYHALHTMQSSMVQPILHFRQVRIALPFQQSLHGIGCSSIPFRVLYGCCCVDVV